MADNNRQDEIFELTEEMAKDTSEKASEQSADADSDRTSSIPPTAISPFQPLIDPDAQPEEDDPPPTPDPDPRPSFEPIPIANAVRVSPIQQVIGKTESVPPPEVNQPPPQPIQDTVSKPPPSQDDEKKESVEEAPMESSPLDEAVAAAVERIPVEYEQLEPTALSDEKASEPTESQTNGDTESPNIQDDIDVLREVEDSLSEKTNGNLSSSETDDDEIPIDLPEKSKIRPDKTQEQNEMDEDDDAEELDLSEAEEMPKAPPAPPAKPPSQAGDARKPRLRRRQKRNREWWAKIFNDDYVSTIPKATVRGDQRKVNFIEKSLGVAANALILDLACGNGRHAVGMAKRGYRVVGIDLSLPMLAQAAELAQEENQNINFIHGDMRDLSFDKTFDSVFCMGTSFGYFDDETNFKVLQGVYRSLKPGGTFLIEVANRDHVITQTPDLTWFEGNGSICMEESYFDFYTSRLQVTRQLIMDGGRQVQNDISIRLYTLSELCNMFNKLGFVVGQISGHTATKGAFFGPDSVRIFMIAQRPIS